MNENCKYCGNELSINEESLGLEHCSECIAEALNKTYKYE